MASLMHRTSFFTLLLHQEFLVCSIEFPTLPCRPIMIVFTSGWRVTTKARDQNLLAGDLREYVAVLR